MASLKPTRRHMSYNEDWFNGVNQGGVQPIQLATGVRAISEIITIVDVCVEDNHSQVGLGQFQHFRVEATPLESLSAILLKTHSMKS